ncbi:MAG: VWA domain-containing protein [Verrucomicrobia bacterium]|nr:VWA domain-containing protein [Verrucomicrobiota bacterium]
MILESPWALLILLALPVILLWRARRISRAASIRFSSTSNAAKAGMSVRQRLGAVPLGIRLLTLTLLAVAIARPQKGLQQVHDLNKGIAIEMVVDRSGSMAAEMKYEGDTLNRLEVVKRAFSQFVLGNGKTLKGRPNDLIGMITFARYPDTVAPLTLAHGALPRFLETVRLVQQDERSEDGTAIGDAIALAAARLKTAEEVLASQLGGENDDYEIKSKVMIVLTDGANNGGKRAPLEAAKLASEWGIKIYTIGVGGDEAITSQGGVFGTFKFGMGNSVDEATLKAVAQATGGLYRLATDAESLEAIYREIDELERSEIESVRYMDYEERFFILAAVALLLIGLETLLGSTFFRKIP